MSNIVPINTTNRPNENPNPIAFAFLSEMLIV